jgi:cobalt-zinc-cadmium efflux system protein
MSGHDHSHGADAASQRGKLIIVFAITATVMVAEIVGTFLTGSLALLADAGHMFTDAAGLLIALIAASLALKPATLKRTWGYKRAEIVAAAGQAALLLGVGGFVIVEGIRRLIEPTEVGGSTMLWFGVIGLAGNAIGLLVLASGRHHNFNMRAAFLEVLNDALGSVAVIAAAIIITLTGWTRADAVVSLLIGALIIPRTLKLLRDTVNVLMENAPAGLDLGEVREHILSLPTSLTSMTCTPPSSPPGHLSSQPTSPSRTPACRTVTQPPSWPTCNAASPNTSKSASNTPPSRSSRPPTAIRKPCTTDASAFLF